MVVIEDLNLINCLISSLENIIEKPIHLNSDWALSHNWSIVPTESASHFNEITATQLANAVTDFGYNQLFAVITENVKNYPPCFQVSATTEDLLNFSWECGFLNYVLFPSDKSFIILCTINDYQVVAGSSEFVKAAVSMDVIAAKEAFKVMALDSSQPVWQKKIFMEVLRRYIE